MGGGCGKELSPEKHERFDDSMIMILRTIHGQMIMGMRTTMIKTMNYIDLYWILVCAFVLSHVAPKPYRTQRVDGEYQQLHG
jgi:hypothetical protein